MNSLLLLSPAAAASPAASGTGAAKGRTEAGPGEALPFASLLQGAGLGVAPPQAVPVQAQPPPVLETGKPAGMENAAQPGLDLPLAGNGLPPVAAPALPPAVSAPPPSPTAVQIDPLAATGASVLPAASETLNGGADNPPPLAADRATPGTRVGAEIAAALANPGQVALAEQGRASPTLPPPASPVAEAMLSSRSGKPSLDPPPLVRLPAQPAVSALVGAARATAAAQASHGEAEPVLVAAAPGAEVGRSPTADLEFLASRGTGPLPQTAEGHTVGSQSNGLAPAAAALLGTGSEGSAPAPRAATGLPQALYSDPGSPEFSGELFLHLRASARPGSGPQEATLQLHPADLGRLHIAITTDGDQARVVFSADNPAARDAIEASLPRLRELMDQGGLQLVQAEVGHRSQADPEQPDAGEGQPQPGDSLAAGADHETGAAPATALGMETPRLLDCYV